MRWNRAGGSRIRNRGQGQGQLSAWACRCPGGSEGAKDAGVTISSEPVKPREVPG